MADFISGLLGAQRFLNEKQNQRLAEEHNKAVNNLTDQRAFLDVIQGLQSARQFGGKTGKLIAQQSLQRLGVAEDVAKSMASEDDEFVNQQLEPAITGLIRNNPSMTLSEAQQMVRQLKPHELLDLLTKQSDQEKEQRAQRAMEGAGLTPPSQTLQMTPGGPQPTQQLPAPSVGPQPTMPQPPA